MELCSRLERLAVKRPTQQARRDVEAALTHKWEGVQVHAGRVLASWGGRRSIDALRQWLVSSMGKEGDSALRAEAVKALCRCFEPRDATWMLDLYFEARGIFIRHQLLPFVTAVPRDQAERRIAIERDSTSETRRAAATVAGRRLRAIGTHHEK